MCVHFIKNRKSPKFGKVMEDLTGCMWFQPGLSLLEEFVEIMSQGLAQGHSGEVEVISLLLSR